jgi:thioredoxin 1
MGCFGINLINKNMKYKIFFVFAMSLIMIGGGCNKVSKEASLPINPNTEAGDVQNIDGLRIEVEGKNYSFTPNVITINKGETVTIDFYNSQGFHDFVIDKLNVKTKKINTGNKTSVTFVANKAGEFEFYCSVGNHRAQGMVGKLIVKDIDEQVAEVKVLEEVPVVEETIVVEEILQNLPGTYEVYSPEKLALAKENNVVLFFHAAWCPTCRRLESNLNKTLDDIPTDLNILQVNYDDANDLRKKYSITYQHTLVQVDEKGNQITKWTGGSDLQSILDKLK